MDNSAQSHNKLNVAPTEETQLPSEVAAANNTLPHDSDPRDRGMGDEIADHSDLADPKSSELSAEFVGRWSNLISTTNWSKGQIITEWRDALMGSESPEIVYSDEAWSRRVGGVSAQHVGRLRRVFERFGDSHTTYAALYWSHFLAALDWDDAEMWLEGAVQSRWSVSQMRRTRWEAMGGDPNLRPNDTDIVSASSDEDYQPQDFEPLSEADKAAAIGDGTRSVYDGDGSSGPLPEGPDFGDESGNAAASGVATDDELPWDEMDEPPESPFANLPSLPVDVSGAVEQFKLAIIRHRSSSWSDVSQADVLKAIEALRLFTSS